MYNKFNCSAGKAFRQRRHDLQKTLDEMARSTGITTVSLSKLELGQIGEPQLRFTLKYGMSLGFSPLEVLSMYGLDISVPETEKGIGEIEFLLRNLPETKRKELLKSFSNLISTAIERRT